MTRTFDAPRAVVFEALTRPEVIKRWFHGPPGWRLAVCEVDLRVGGAFRFAWRGPGGAERGMCGTYREIVPPERLVSTQVLDEPCAPEAIVTILLAERKGRTVLSLQGDPAAPRHARRSAAAATLG